MLRWPLLRVVLLLLLLLPCLLSTGVSLEGADFARSSGRCVLLAILATLARDGPVLMPVRVHDRVELDSRRVPLVGFS